MYESFDFTNDRLDIKLNAFKDKEGENLVYRQRGC